MTILGGKSNSVCHLTFAPKPEIAFRSMPTGLSFVLVTPTRKVEIDNETEQKKIASMKAEYLLTAKLLAKRLDQPNPLTVKSLGALLRTMDISVAKMLELITTNDISDESTVRKSRFVYTLLPAHASDAYDPSHLSSPRTGHGGRSGVGARRSRCGRA